MIQQLADVCRGRILRSRNAAAVGDAFAQAFAALQERHPLIGDVRGRGLLRGVELVRDRALREPAAAEAERLQQRLLEAGVVVGLCGADHNVLKINPPLCATVDDIALLADACDTPSRGCRLRQTGPSGSDQRRLGRAVAIRSGQIRQWYQLRLGGSRPRRDDPPAVHERRLDQVDVRLRRAERRVRRQRDVRQVVSTCPAGSGSIVEHVEAGMAEMARSAAPRPSPLRRPARRARC